MPRRNMLLHLLVESPIDSKVELLGECKKMILRIKNLKLWISITCEWAEVCEGRQ
jgi:hypothetical protein